MSNKAVLGADAPAHADIDHCPICGDELQSHFDDCKFACLTCGYVELGVVG